MPRRLRHDALAMARGEHARHDAGAAIRRLRKRGVGAVDIRRIVEGATISSRPSARAPVCIAGR